MLRPIIILLLDGEAVDVIGVHDMLDSLVVVKDGQSRHFVKVGQVLIVAVTTLDELITGVLQGCPLQGLVTHHARLALLVSLLGPVGTLSIVKVLRDAEFSMKYFALFINLVLKYVLTSQIVVVIVHGEHVVLDCLLRDLLVGWHEILFISFAKRLAMSVTYDVPITNLLVDGRIVDESALHLGGRLISHRLLHVLHLKNGVHGSVGFLALRTHHSVIHLLKVITDTDTSNSCSFLTHYGFTI